jgi:hypothetical protein
MPAIAKRCEIMRSYAKPWERRGQDSNLRTSFPVTDLANRRFRPLSHLSQRFWTSQQAQIQTDMLILPYWPMAASETAGPPRASTKDNLE